MLEGKKHQLLSFILALLVIAGPIAPIAHAESALNEAATAANPPPLEDPALAFTTEVDGVAPDDLAREVLKQDPSAKVLVAAEPPASDDQSATDKPTKADADIVVQQADSLNTTITVLSYANEDRLYFISPTHTLLQKAGVTLFNLYFMKYWDLRPGSWTKAMQLVERSVISKGLRKIPRLTETQVSKISPYLSHAALIYLTYLAYQFVIDFSLPHWHSGPGAIAFLLNVLHASKSLFLQAFGAGPLYNNLRKAGFGYFSGFGWTLLSRKWDPLKDSERPISRQAYTVFNTIRGTAVGYFVPQMVMAGSSVSLAHFAMANSPFLISAAAGGLFYVWGDRILARYPQIARSLERFQQATEKLNQKMNQARDFIVRKWNATPCSRLLRRRAKTGAIPPG